MPKDEKSRNSKKHYKKRRRRSSTSSDDDASASRDRRQRVRVNLERRIRRLERELEHKSRSRSRRRSVSASNDLRRTSPLSRARSSCRRSERSPTGDMLLSPSLHDGNDNQRGRTCSPLIGNIDVCNVENENIHGDHTLILHSDVDLSDGSQNLPDNVINILGVNPEKLSNTKFKIHEALVPRWRFILQNGLKKEDSTSLLDRYELPFNLPELSPPQINPEIAAILSKFALTKDQSYVTAQSQLAKGICAIAESLNTLLETPTMPQALHEKMISNLTDSSRILTNLFHRMSLTRRNLIFPLLNKGIKDQIENFPPTDLLFGSDLAEKIKSAKAIESVGKDLKVPVSVPGPSSRFKKGGGTAITKTSPVQPNLNYRHPARRTKETRPVKGQSSGQRRAAPRYEQPRKEGRRSRN